MGLNDELEKVRQAAEWLKTEPTDTERYRAAMSHLIWVSRHDLSKTVRDAAQNVLDNYQPVWME